MNVTGIAEYRRTFKENYGKYFMFALNNWYALQDRASVKHYGDNAISIAEQIQQYTGCPYFVAEDIANCISCSKATQIKI